ncbi:MAG: hypothetical protein DMG49_20095 [Acidobacteria bacterium]|nr:MAG: hypothetical protein DMG49_20095 [Acidobacteriota bacterium]
MTAKPAVDEIRLSRVLLLLALSVFINYLDRGNLSIAAPACGTLADGILISRFGWRPVFLLVGLTSLLWLLPWLRWMPKGHRDSPSQSGLSAPGMLQILEQRSAWGTCVGLFCMNYLMYFLLTWLPFYLMHERHFSLATMAKIAGLAYFLMAVAATSAGWVSDRGIASGKTLTLVRKTFMVVGQVGAGISLAACVVSGPALPVVCLLLAAAFWGISAGKWTGLQNFLGNLAGWIAPVVTGLVVDKTGRFFWAFIITAVIALLGSLSWIFIVGTLRQVDWSARPAYADSR